MSSVLEYAKPFISTPAVLKFVDPIYLDIYVYTAASQGFNGLVRQELQKGQASMRARLSMQGTGGKASARMLLLKQYAAPLLLH